MNIFTYSPHKGKAINPNIDNLLDLQVILWRYPIEPLEAANVGYFERELKKRLESPLTGGPIDYKFIPRFLGPDIKHEPNDTIVLTQKFEKKISGVMVEVDSFGRVNKVTTKITPDMYGPNFKIDWRTIIGKPTNTVGYKIVDLAIRNKPNVLTGNTKVKTILPVGTNSPVPIEYANKRFEESGVRLDVGTILPKHKGSNTKDFLLANGAEVLAKDEPEIVLHLTGDPKATKAKLPDYEDTDHERYGSRGIAIRTYIKVRK